MDKNYCDICARRGIREPAQHKFMECGKEVHLCDDCAMERFNISVYNPQFKCYECSGYCDRLHYIDVDGRHFDSVRCAIDFHKNRYGD